MEPTQGGGSNPPAAVARTGVGPSSGVVSPIQPDLSAARAPPFPKSSRVSASRRVGRWLMGSRLRLAGLGYMMALGIFAGLLLASPDQLFAILGTLVFTVLATLLAALKFSGDLERSTANQINALRDLSTSELEAAQGRNRESIAALRDATREQV